MNTSSSLLGDLITAADNFVSESPKLPRIYDSTYPQNERMFVKYKYLYTDTHHWTKPFGSPQKNFIRHDYKSPIRRERIPLNTGPTGHTAGGEYTVGTI